MAALEAPRTTLFRAAQRSSAARFFWAMASTRLKMITVHTLLITIDTIARGSTLSGSSTLLFPGFTDAVPLAPSRRA